MKIFITSDIHFSHKNIMNFCPESRPFTDIDHMDNTIIKIWNETITSKDLTYIIGDVAFCNAEKAVSYMHRLNGKKVLVTGNHDHKLVKDQNFLDCFESVVNLCEISHNGTKVVMFHYPIYEWNNMHRGSVHFHGHLHARPHGIAGRIFDVAMDGNDCVPYDMSALIKHVLKQPIRTHGDGN